MEWMRTLVRPVLTLSGMLTLSAAVLQGREVPDFYTALVSGMLAWWFYDRSKKKGKT